MKPSIYWYDYETFGISPKYDRIAQFAGVRTDFELNIIDEPLKIYNRPTPDFLPGPEACLVTGITPLLCLQQGLPEVEFIQEINQRFSQPATVVSGYNNIHFDDEFTRYTLYRNLMDPYAREWQNGNSRWDVINLMRLTAALRPDGINWPLNEKGLPSFRLELLTEANRIDHLDAHDALSDVYATIAMAKLVMQAQPKLYHYVFEHRLKNQLVPLIDCNKKTPLVHSSSRFLSEYYNTSVIMPLCWHPKNKNSVIAYDLRHNPQDLIALDAEEIKQRIYTAKEELEQQGKQRIAIKTIQINQAPVLAPLNTLDEKAQKRIQLDHQTISKHYQMLMQAKAIEQKLIAIFTENAFADSEDDDVDSQLYSGSFFRPQDKNLMAQVLETPAEELVGYMPPFKDSRLPEMLFRFRARNYPETLTAAEQQQWQDYCRDKLQHNPYFNLKDFDAQLQQKKQENPEQMAILQQLQQWRQELAEALGINRQ